MRQRAYPPTFVLAAGLSLGLSLLAAGGARAQEPAAAIKIGFVTFLSGPAAAPFGIPDHNAAEMLVEKLNAGQVPAPYNTVGLGGTRIEGKFVDEAGSVADVVTQFRNLVERDHVDVVVGYVSSGNCLAITPVAEELKQLTVLDICGTTRIFEEKPRHYVFRVNAHATMDNVSAAKYALSKFKDISVYSGINQNYAWGQDSWRDFRLAMKNLDAKATIDKELFPKLFAGEYGAEISTLLTSNAQFIHSSFYDGDLEAFIYQSAARGLPQRIPLVLTTGESSLWRLGAKLPDGAIIGARGPHTFFAHDSELNTWFHKSYVDRFKEQPIYPAYDLAQSLFGLKTAWEKAQAKKGGARPTTEEVIDAFEGISFPTPSTTVQMALGNGHQGLSDTAVGSYKFDKAEGKPEIVDIVRYPAQCVNPPADVDSVPWLEGGMKGAKCD
ncbi:MAG: ABC transporter substrate-binding protein [Xanthobacteraceae bacterium]|jgi:branched-chain amino acid transport system substrate-binding protein